MWELVRWIGKIVKFWEDRLASIGASRRAESPLAGHTLYHFQVSPYSARVRRAVRSLGLAISMIDVLEDDRAYQELIGQGGKDQVPCLKIETAGGKTEWMYESTSIVDYLRKKRSSAAL